MDSRIGHEFRNAVHNFFNNHNVNFCITAAIGIAATYASFITILGQDLVHPLLIHTDESLNDVKDTSETVMSLLILWIIAAVVGKLFNLLNLPFVFGAMLVGILVGNIPFLNIFSVNAHWEFQARRLALAVLIVRWGLGLNLALIYKNIKTILWFAIATPCVEILTVASGSVLLFGIDWRISLILGSVMSAASTPIITPVMLELNNAGLGLEKKLSKIIPPSVSIDTIFCLTVFTVNANLLFAKDTLLTTIVIMTSKVVLCAVAGILSGLLLWFFPKSQEGHTLFSRGYLLMFIAIAAINGMFYFGLGYAGIVYVLHMISVASLKWREDNPSAMFSLEKNYLYIWNFLACPILFVLVGMKLKFYLMTWSAVGAIVSLIALGFMFRVAGGLLVTSCSDLKFREQLVFVLSMVPKATLQGALGPSLLQYTEDFPEWEDTANFIVNACLTSVLITAPLGRLLLARAAPTLLGRTFTQTVQIVASEADTPGTTPDMHSEEKLEDQLDSVQFTHFKTLQQQHKS